MHIPNQLRLVRALSSVVLILILTACAGSPSESIPIEEQMAQKGYIIQEPVKRLKDYRINGFSSVDRSSVILYVGASDHYLVTVRSLCDELRSAEHLAFSTIIGDLTDKDRLIVRDSGGHIQYCYIDTIHKLDKIN
jgi:hypothetical protein